MERRQLSENEIRTALEKVSEWKLKANMIVRRFEFGDFSAALEFVNRVGAIANEMDHHPDIKLGWGYAEFELTTHDRGGVTDVDLTLAAKINEL